MADVPDRVFRILRGLMAKEDSLRNINTEDALNEAEAAAEKVAELMLRYKIQASQLEMQTAQARRSPLGHEVYRYDGTEAYKALSRTAWEVQLVSAVARAHNCRALIGRGYFVFLGEDQDRAVAMEMFRILRRELTTTCKSGYAQARREGRNTRGYITSFFAGAVARITIRYEAMRQRVVADTQSTALVRQFDDALDEYAREQTAGRKPIKVNYRGRMNRDGYIEGRTLGDSVSLTSNGIGADKPRTQIGGA